MPKARQVLLRSSRNTQRFREQLPNHAQAAGTNSRSHGEFVLPSVPRAKRRMDTFAQTNQQQGSDRTEKQIQCRPERPGVYLNDAAYLDAKRFRILRGRLLGELLQDGLKFALACAAVTPGRSLIEGA